MSIEERLQQDLKTAMRAKERLRVDVIRMARAALQSAQQAESKQRYDEAVRAIEAQHADNEEERAAALEAIEVPAKLLDDEAEQAVIRREIKRRREAAELYAQAGQTDSQEQEQAEAAILEEYLPRQLTADELRPQVVALIAELGLSGPGDMGKAMPALLERFKGQADGRVLSQLAREALS